MSAKIRFGTDGWRGIIAQDYTFDNVRLCAQGVASYINRAGLKGRGLVIGYDTRFASEDFAAAAAEVVAANGIKVYLGSRPLPTPVISFATRRWSRAGAIIITASHNPYQWNGFKFKTGQGCPAPAAVEREIEREIEQSSSSLPLRPSARGLIEPFDPLPDYKEHLSTLVDLKALRQFSQKVVIDSMYGAGMGLLKELLHGGKLRVTEIHGQRNPLFPGLQPEPVAANLKELSATVKDREGGVGMVVEAICSAKGLGQCVPNS
ncbi:MAG: phosphoglucomutase/phosphomannomutase family protein, partial [Chloroflexota bacterium]